VTKNVHFIAILPLKAISLHKRGQIPGMIELEAVVPHKENCDALINFEEVKQLATIDELAGMRARTPKPAWARRVVGEGVT